MVGPTKISTGPHVLEKQHFVGEKAEQWSSTVQWTVEHGSIVALFTKVNSAGELIHAHCSREQFFF
jgi:hypothetical protein